MLVERTANPGDRLLVLPVCYLYRHFIELELKELIQDCEHLHALLDQWNEARGVLVARERELDQTHSIKTLLDWLLERLPLVMEEPPPLDPSIQVSISELHTEDPVSTTFRYARQKKDGSPSIPWGRLIHVSELKEGTDEAGTWFSKLRDYLRSKIEAAEDLEQEIRAHEENLRSHTESE